MRKVLALSLFSLGVASLVCPAQRGGMAPSIAAPAMRAMPAAPSAGAHAAVPAHGAAPAHGAVPAHGAPAHSGARAGALGAHVVTNHGAGNPAQHQPWNSGGDGNFHPFYPYPTNLLPGISDNFAGSYPVPGLGFDYAHFFAVHPNWGRFHPVDGVVLSYGGGGGFYMPVPYYTESTPEEGEEEVNANEPQPVSHQQVVVEEPVAPSRARSGSYVSSEPVSEFVFVKHDGSTFSAVGYTWTKGKLQYVTKDALSHIIGIETLDIPATEHINEDRGITVNFPKSLLSSVADDAAASRLGNPYLLR